MELGFCLRRMQDPMMEIAQLFNAEEDLYCLNFHQLQHLMDKEEFLEALQLEFINRSVESDEKRWFHS